MNKSELIQCLRDPSKLKPEQLAELDKLIHQYPAFLSARLIMAKASKELKHTKAKKFIASAAIYSTDRVLLKKYLSGDLFFLTKPSEAAQPTRRQRAAFAAKIESKSSGDQPEKQKPGEVKTRKESAPPSKKTPKSSPEADKKKERATPPRTDKKTDDRIQVDSRRSQPSVPDLPSGSLDAILESLERDMENLKASREKFLQVQEKISEEDTKAPLKTSEVESEVESEKEAAEKPEVNASSDTLEETSPPEVQNTVEENETAEEYSPEAGIEVSPAPDKQKAISDITKQVLEAARIAKEEVAKEDALADNANEETQPELEKTQESTSTEKPEEQSDKEIDTSVAEQIQEEKVESKSFFDENSPSPSEAIQDKDPEETSAEEKPAVKESSKKGKKEVAKKAKPKKDSEEEDTSERAERAFQEPRFSRFSTRSYLRPPEEIDMSGFLDDDENEKAGGVSKTLPEEPSSPVPEETKPRTSADSEASSNQIEKGLEDTAKSNENLSKTATGESATESTSSPKEESEDSNKKPAEVDEQAELEKKYNLPDLSKAKAVPRKSKPRKKKIAAETNSKAENTKSSVKSDDQSTGETKKGKDANKNADDSSSVVTEKIDPKEAAKGSGIKKKDPKDLIEDFIQKSPTIKYKRTEDASPEDLAQESAAWDPNLASEYLAEIYLNQGNKKRAKEIYEALSLKYPEKKSYFADLISKIK